MSIAAVVCTAALALSACGGGNGDEPAATGTAGTTEAPQSDIKVGMAYDVGGRGDQSFNDAAAAGLDKAKEEFGVESQESSATAGEPESAREERLRQLAEAGYNAVVAVGFAYGPALGKVAPEYPEVNFSIVDDASLEAVPNVASLVFAEEQGSFLVGAAAALKSEANNIGFVGGVETDLIKKFEAGYKAGAEAVKPDIEVQVTYLTQVPDFSGFNDPAKGKTAAEGMYDGGADVVYQAAGGSGAGVFEAAQAAGASAIGVDSDQALTAPEAVRDVIITSMLKKVDVAVYDWIKSLVDGDPLTGVSVYDLEADGVGYSTTGGKIDDITEQLDEFKQQIIDGEIKVPTTPAA